MDVEAAFIAYLEEAEGEDAGAASLSPGPSPVNGSGAIKPPPPQAGEGRGEGNGLFSLRRLLGVAHRETMALRRDAIRPAFALLGSMLRMFVLGYGVSMDVEGLRFGVLDRDQTPEAAATSPTSPAPAISSSARIFGTKPTWSGAWVDGAMHDNAIGEFQLDGFFGISNLVQQVAVFILAAIETVAAYHRCLW